MTQQCKFIRSNGQRCKRRQPDEYCFDHHPDRKLCAQPGCTKAAMAGLDYCQFHRRDGVATPGFKPGHKVNRLRIKSGWYTQPLTHIKLVDTLLRFEFLLDYIKTLTDLGAYQKAAEFLSRLSFRLNQELKDSDYTPEEIETLIREEKARVRARLEAEAAAQEALTKNQNTHRALRYYKILNYIEDYFNRHHQSPTYQEIANELNLSISVLQHYLRQLIKDKKIHKTTAPSRCLRLGENKIKQLRFTFETDT